MKPDSKIKRAFEIEKKVNNFILFPILMAIIIIIFLVATIGKIGAISVCLALGVGYSLFRIVAKRKQDSEK